MDDAIDRRMRAFAFAVAFASSRASAVRPRAALARASFARIISGVNAAHSRTNAREGTGGMASRRARATRSQTNASDSLELHAKEDKYGGVVIDDERFPEALSSPIAFGEALDDALTRWRERERRGVWLKLSLARAACVPIACERGFEYHHAEREYVMLVKWLPTNEESTIPANASHQVGVGAFVYDKTTKKVLLVQERRGPASGRDLWKMPTGLIEAGEDVPVAAMREVMEETGIDAEFDVVIGCRHAHVGAWGKSDMFFCVALVVKDGVSREIQMQAQEIARAKWATMEEFLSNPHVQPGSHAHALHALCEKWANGEYAGIRAQKLPLGFGRPGEVYTYVAHE